MIEDIIRVLLGRRDPLNTEAVVTLHRARRFVAVDDSRSCPSVAGGV